MQARKKKISKTKINFLIDLVIFIAFLLAMDPRLTGFAIHEWLSIAFAAAIIIHLLLHWQWITTATRRLFGKLASQARLNYIINILFFIAMTIVIFTGVMISEEALPLFGIHFARNFFWRLLHSFAADASLFLIGLHVAVHWKWIVNAFKRYVMQPLTPNRIRRLTQREAQA